MGSLLRSSRKLAILDIDIETTPYLVYQWDPIHPVPVTPDMIVKRGGLLSFAWRWGWSEKVHFHAIWNDNHLVDTLWGVLDMADIVRHFNGQRFDEPRAEREFALAHLGKPSSYRTVDLYMKAVRGRWPLGKMEQVAREFGIASKVEHGGAKLWVACLDGDPEAQALMERYNKRDVELIRELVTEFGDWL